MPRTGPVTTLCGQSLGEGAFTASDLPPDCANCIRRSRDQSRISSAFFESEEGSELLRLSLEQARARKPTKADAAAPPRKPNLRVVPPPPPPPSVPAEVGELVTEGFKSKGQGVWTSPAGVIVRMGGKNRDEFAELVFEGSVIATREAAGMRIRAGDVEVKPKGDGVEVRLKR